MSTVPPELADARTLAELYRKRWTLEKAFLHLTLELRCEIDTLAYPPAALFGLACAVVAFNGLGVVKAAARAPPMAWRPPSRSRGTIWRSNWVTLPRA